VTRSARLFPDYSSALMTCYEEEISGEGYFAGLADQFSGRPRQALLMMASVEHVTAAALRPLIISHGLRTADEAGLFASGRAEARRQQGITWESLTAGMAEDYPVYLEEFDQLSRLAPPADLRTVSIALYHEQVLIDFARSEAAGDPESLKPIVQFLARHDGLQPV